MAECLLQSCPILTSPNRYAQDRDSTPKLRSFLEFEPGSSDVRNQADRQVARNRNGSMLLRNSPTGPQASMDPIELLEGLLHQLHTVHELSVPGILWLFGRPPAPAAKRCSGNVYHRV